MSALTAVCAVADDGDHVSIHFCSGAPTSSHESGTSNRPPPVSHGTQLSSPNPSHSPQVPRPSPSHAPPGPMPSAPSSLVSPQQVEEGRLESPTPDNSDQVEGVWSQPGSMEEEELPSQGDVTGGKTPQPHTFKLVHVVCIGLQLQCALVSCISSPIPQTWLPPVKVGR